MLYFLFQFFCLGLNRYDPVLKLFPRFFVTFVEGLGSEQRFFQTLYFLQKFMFLSIDTFE